MQRAFNLRFKLKALILNGILINLKQVLELSK